MLIVRITVSADSITISLCRAALIDELAGSPNNRHRTSTSNDPIILHADVQLERRAQNKRMIVHGDAAPVARPHPRLAGLLTKAQGWKDELMREPELTVRSLGARNGVTRSYVTRILRLACLAPDITHALLDGTAPPAIIADSLSRRHDLPIAWPAQRAMLGFVG